MIRPFAVDCGSNAMNNNKRVIAGGNFIGRINTHRGQDPLRQAGTKHSHEHAVDLHTDTQATRSADLMAMLTTECISNEKSCRRQWAHVAQEFDGRP